MEDYVGKLCPVCKKEIMEADKVRVCPDCGIPHHEQCWEMNSGCSTFGCLQQGTAGKAKPAGKCKKCGTELEEGQEFCPKCGTPKGAPEKFICGKCGNELAEGQAFCPKCGQKAGLTADDNTEKQPDSSASRGKAEKTKVPIFIAVGVAIILAALALGFAVPRVFVSMEGYMEQGNYEKAYRKAKTEEDKIAVKAENAAACQSAFSAYNLKDPSSFFLRDAYYYEEDGTIYLTLYISGANSYGASVSSYWLYEWDEDDGKYLYWCSVSDLTNEEYGKYDDTDEKLEKLTNNLGRSLIKICMNGGIKLNKAAVKRINNLYEKDVLDEVELLDLY